MRKVLYKKTLKKELALVFIDIDSNINFEAYRTQLIAIDDYLMRYKFNFNRVVYSTILKIEYSDPALKLTRDNIIKWETIIAVSKPKNRRLIKIGRKESKKKLNK